MNYLQLFPKWELYLPAGAVPDTRFVWNSLEA